MVSNISLDNKIPITDQVKKGIRHKMYDKHIIFNTNTVFDMGFGPGSHTFSIKTFNNRINLGNKILLLHYKFIGGKERLQKRYRQFGKRLSKDNINVFVLCSTTSHGLELNPLCPP